MYLLILIPALVWVPLITATSLTFESDSGSDRINNHLTTETLARRYGYPFEKHTVQTEDGYILEIHRIPYSPKSNSSSAPRKVSFLFHCLLCSSSEWIILGPNNSLGLMLADAGYDVWMGNARGNTYSRNHTDLNVNGVLNDKFWNFSWHEIGMIDLPTMLDYVRNKTGVEQVAYFGHSQGTTTFLVLTSMKPEYNKIFKSAHLLSPVAFYNNGNNTFLRTTGPLLGRLTTLQSFLGSTEFRPSKELMNIVGNTLCADSSEYRVLCRNALLLAAGFTNETVNRTAIPDVMASTPAGASTKQIFHYIQEYVSGHFRQYDHGLVGNLKAYGSLSPPDYPLENVNVPIFLYHSVADSLASVKDVNRLAMNLKSLAGTFLNTIFNFDHMAHLYSENLGEKVNKYVMRDLESIK